MLQLILNVELSFEAQLLQSFHTRNDIFYIPVRTHLEKQINFQLETFGI